MSLYSRVPKDFRANLEWRRNLLRKCDDSDSFRDDVLEMCQHDILFWINAFAFLFEPRTAKVLPFITYEYQDSGILEIDDSITKGEDCGLFKSRDAGASWAVITVLKYRWLFRKLQKFLIISRKEELVDSIDDPKSLMWKSDHIMKWLPEWMRPTQGISDRTKMHDFNPETGSVIDGESTTESSTVGDRRLAVVADEFAHFPDGGFSFWQKSRDVTNCRIPIFTPNGTGNAASDLVQKGETRLIRWHWSQHPDKARGIYKSDGSNLKPDHPNKLRSPWYDAQCKRALHPSEIASELDMDFLGSGFQYFDEQELKAAEERTVRDADAIGDLRFDLGANTTINFEATPTGTLSLWCPIIEGAPPKSDYVVGADISMGTGSSSSAAVVIDVRSGFKVAELVTSEERPDEFADSVYTLCQFFGEPHLVWEANGGGGTQFMKQIVRLGYRNFFYRRQEDRLVPNAKGDQPGFWQTGQLKVSLAGQYRKALLDGTYIERSKRCLDECRQYVYAGKTIKHMKSTNAFNPADEDENHGDVAIATWLAVFAAGMQAAVVSKESIDDPPYGSLAYWMAQDKKGQSGGEAWPFSREPSRDGNNSIALLG